LILATLLLMMSMAKRDLVQIDVPDNTEAVAGKPFEVQIKFFVADGYHINSNKPTEEYMIPTQVDWEPSSIKHLSDVFPKPDSVEFPFTHGKKLSVYQRVQVIKAKFSVPASGVTGKINVDGTFRYQACDNAACYPPNKVEFRIPVTVR
jgi:hypothetical protein